jgi:hypothetical protein
MENENGIRCGLEERRMELDKVVDSKGYII